MLSVSAVDRRIATTSANAIIHTPYTPNTHSYENAELTLTATSSSRENFVKPRADEIIKEIIDLQKNTKLTYQQIAAQSK